MVTAAVASEILKTWHRDHAEKRVAIYSQIFPEYQLLIESYLKARSVGHDGEHSIQPGPDPGPIKTKK